LTWTRLPPWRELVEADGLVAFLGVLNTYRRRGTLGLADQPDLAGLCHDGGAVWVPVGGRFEPRAVYRVTTINLDTASTATRREARAKWGGVLNALPHPIQVVIRATPATTSPVRDRIKAHGSAQAHGLAAWLGRTCTARSLSNASASSSCRAEDLEQFSDRCASLETSMRRIGLPLERIEDVD